MAAAVLAAEVDVADRVWLLMEGSDVGRTGVVCVGDITRVDHVYAAGEVDSLQVSAIREAGISFNDAV